MLTAEPIKSPTLKARCEGSVSQDSSVVVEVRNLKKSYGQQLAVKDVSFSFHGGEVLGLAIHSTRLFQTGWFVESLLTQTVIIHIIRTNRIPFLQSWPSWPLLLMSTLIMSIGIAIPFTSLGSYLGFVPLPPLYWLLLAISMVCYVAVTQLVKMWLLKRRWI